MEYASLLAEEVNQEVKNMELTWADKIELGGIEQGIQRGKQQGMRQLVLKLAEKHLGPSNDQARSQLEKIDSAEELAELAERAMVAGSWAELGLV